MNAWRTGAADEVRLQLGDVLRMRGRIGADESMTGLLHFGPGEPGALPAQGLVVRGLSESLDAAGWIAFAAKGEGTGALREVDLRVARLDLLGSPFADTRLQLAREAASTRVSLEGPAISGRVDIPAELALGVQAGFSRLHWP